MAFNYQVISVNTTLSGNSYIFADTSGDNLTITLPYAGNVDGRLYEIKKSSAQNHLLIQDSDPDHFSDHVFAPTTQAEMTAYAEFMSASGNWHLLNRSGVSERWAPSASANVVAWFDASDATSISSSAGNVLQWKDKSGNDYHASQSTANKHPRTGTRTINGLNVIDFDGTSDALKYAANFFTSNHSYTKIAVYFTDNLGATNNVVTIGNSALYNELIIFHGGNQLSSSSYPGILSPMIAIGQYVSGGQADIFINGTNVGSNPAPAAWANSANHFELGAHSGGNYLDGVIAEVVVLDHAASADLRQKIEGYLAWKWGLRANLPSSHPYKYTPATK